MNFKFYFTLFMKNILDKIFFWRQIKKNKSEIARIEANFIEEIDRVSEYVDTIDAIRRKNSTKIRQLRRVFNEEIQDIDSNMSLITDFFTSVVAQLYAEPKYVVGEIIAGKEIKSVSPEFKKVGAKYALEYNYVIGEELLSQRQVDVMKSKYNEKNNKDKGKLN